jgi:hypothetical protein
MVETDSPERLIKIMWDRRQQGDLVADIGHDLGYTPLEVLDILRAERKRRESRLDGKDTNPG